MDIRKYLCLAALLMMTEGCVILTPAEFLVLPLSDVTAKMKTSSTDSESVLMVTAPEIGAFPNSNMDFIYRLIGWGEKNTGKEIHQVLVKLTIRMNSPERKRKEIQTYTLPITRSEIDAALVSGGLRVQFTGALGAPLKVDFPANYLEAYLMTIDNIIISTNVTQTPGEVPPEFLNTRN